MMIPQREETGIYEDHPGLNPTYERDLGEDFERICSELSRLFYLSPRLVPQPRCDVPEL